ncbi:MAG: hypothetical protein WA005_13735 [Candidatus Binataceae bacterium]
MKYFQVEQHEHSRVWTIVNPPMNYMTLPMTQELNALVEQTEADEAVGAIF